MVDNQRHEVDPEVYLSEHKAWHSNRLMELKKPDGWLSLIGLHWLQPGENTFGSDPANSVVFPDLPGIPDRIGSFFVDKSVVRMVVQPGVNVTIQSGSVTDSVIFGKSKSPIIVNLESLQWQIIKRKDLIGIRLRDTANPAIEAFEGIESFPVSLDWRVPARFDRYDPPRRIEIENVLGHITPQNSPGAVVFRIGTEEFRLDVTGNPEAETFFIVFGDMTNGQETYKRGRFLSVDAPNEQGYLYIDFNKAFNPPCGFTAYATCPIPPLQNRLLIQIEAGEKSVHAL